MANSLDGGDAAQAPTSHFTMGIFVRSIVMATTAISTAPKMTLCANMLTPRIVMPMRTTEMIKAPASVRQVLPTRPVSRFRRRRPRRSKAAGVRPPRSATRSRAGRRG